MKETEVKKAVREGYGRIVKRGSSCCSPGITSCCGVSVPETISRRIGYSDAELDSVPDGANLGLGCGNPTALASLKEGETVLDLGSGAGFDCFLAANRVGKGGRVIGVDMTPEMINKAKSNARKGKYKNVEFRLGDIEKLPVDDSSVDVIISNCVINLAPDKSKVFKEAHRVLKAGGRAMVSDLVLLQELPDFIKNSVEAYVGCVSGAMMKADYVNAVKSAGFKDVKIMEETCFPVESMSNDPTVQAIIDDLKIAPEALNSMLNSVVSVKISATK